MTKICQSFFKSLVGASVFAGVFLVLAILSDKPVRFPSMFRKDHNLTECGTKYETRLIKWRIDVNNPLLKHGGLSNTAAKPIGWTGVTY